VQLRFLKFSVSLLRIIYIYFFRTKISFKVMEFRNMLSHVRIDSRMISLTSQTLNSRVIEEDVVLERINIFYSLFSFLFLILVLGFYRIFSRISKLALIFIVQIHSCILASGFLVTSTKKHCGYKFVSFREIFNILLHKRKYIYINLYKLRLFRFRSPFYVRSAFTLSLAISIYFHKSIRSVLLHLFCWFLSQVRRISQDFFICHNLQRLTRS